MIDVAVCIASYGPDLDHWFRLAERAHASAVAEVGEARVIYHHEPDGSLHEVRNRTAAIADTEWLCFLDADDELEPGYMKAMAKGDTDLRAPLVRYVTSPFSKAPPRVPAGTADMADGNRLVIGTLVRKTMFEAVGGFRDWPMYEDWDLWQRCWLAGATIGFTDAVYRAHVRRMSRNRAPTRAEKERVHHAIRRANLPHLYEAAAQ